MAIVYSWSFPSFDVVPSEDGLTNVVKTINWRYDAVEGEYRAGAYGSVELASPNPNDFIPYSNITEQWAIDAVSASVDMNKVKVTLDKSIADQKNPPIVEMAPPF